MSIKVKKETTRINHTVKKTSGFNIDELSPTDNVSQNEPVVKKYDILIYM